MRSNDDGNTWSVRVSTGPFDTHTFATLLQAKNRLYSSAGDEYFENRDGGYIWKRIMSGLSNHQLYGIAVSSFDPDTVMVSAASGPYESHNSEAPRSSVYRRTKDSTWQVVEKGLSEPKGTIISMLVSNLRVRDEFFAMNNRGIFVSRNGGVAGRLLKSRGRGNFLNSIHGNRPKR